MLSLIFQFFLQTGEYQFFIQRLKDAAKTLKNKLPNVEGSKPIANPLQYYSAIDLTSLNNVNANQKQKPSQNSLKIQISPPNDGYRTEQDGKSSHRLQRLKSNSSKGSNKVQFVLTKKQLHSKESRNYHHYLNNK